MRHPSRPPSLPSAEPTRRLFLATVRLERGAAGFPSRDLRTGFSRAASGSAPGKRGERFCLRPRWPAIASHPSRAARSPGSDDRPGHVGRPGALPTDRRPGVYHLRADAAQLRSPSHRISVRQGLPLELDISLAPQLSETVAVASDARSAGGSSGTTLAGVRRRRRAVLRAARSAVQRRLRSARLGIRPAPFRLSAPGVWIALGRRHRSAFAGRIGRFLVGPRRGRPGERTNARALRSRASASRSKRQPGAEPLGRALGPLPGSREPGQLAQSRVHTRRRVRAGLESRLERRQLRAGHARAFIDVPHSEEQEQAGQDQGQAVQQSFATLNWQRSWPRATVSQLALFGRFTKGALSASPSDVPLFAEAAREQDRLGLLAAVTRERGRHRLKAGVELAVRLRGERAPADSFRLRAGLVASSQRVDDRRGRPLRPLAPRPRGKPMEPTARRLSSRGPDHVPGLRQPAVPAAADRIPVARLVTGGATPLAVRRPGRRRRCPHPRRAADRRRGRLRAMAPGRSARRRRGLATMDTEPRGPERVLRHHGPLPEQRRSGERGAAST